jgi:hypothetical protein
VFLLDQPTADSFMVAGASAIPLIIEVVTPNA